MCVCVRVRARVMLSADHRRRHASLGRNAQLSQKDTRIYRRSAIVVFYWTISKCEVSTPVTVKLFNI